MIRGYEMLSIEQCRAARGILGWTQDDLAGAASMSKTAINNFERGLSSPKQDTLKQLRAAFEKNGIEFSGTFGVDKQTETVSVIRGNNAGVLLWDDIIDTLKDTGGEVLISSVNEGKVLQNHNDEFKSHMRRMKEIGISERLLSLEGDTTFIQPRECYRWIPAALYTALSPTFIYGDKVAIKLWRENIIILIHSTDAAAAEKQRFEYLWKNAITPPDNI